MAGKAFGFSPEDHARVARVVRRVEDQTVGGPIERPKKAAAQTGDIREGIWVDDVFPAASPHEATLARFRVYGTFGRTHRVDSEPPITATNRSHTFTASAGERGLVLRVGDEWRPIVAGETCIKAGWLDGPLDEFGRAQMTVASHHGEGTFQPSVRVATTTAGTLASDFEAGDVIDGITLATDDRILIKDQASGIENGPYVVQASGAPVRASEAPTGAAVAEFVWSVEEGDDNDGKEFIVGNLSGSDVVDTDALTFNEFNETWCETSQQVWVVDFVGLGDTLEKNTGIMAMPLCNSSLHGTVAAPCELKETRPLSMSGSDGCLTLSAAGAGGLSLSGA